MRSVGLGAGPVLRQQDSPCHARRGQHSREAPAGKRQSPPPVAAGAPPVPPRAMPAPCPLLRADRCSFLKTKSSKSNNRRFSGRRVHEYLEKLEPLQPLRSRCRGITRADVPEARPARFLLRLLGIDSLCRSSTGPPGRPSVAKNGSAGPAVPGRRASFRRRCARRCRGRLRPPPRRHPRPRSASTGRAFRPR